jgi:hypothetical protein
VLYEIVQPVYLTPKDVKATTLYPPDDLILLLLTKLPKMLQLLVPGNMAYSAFAPPAALAL